MKVLFDTSVLVAAVVERHPRHEKAADWLKRATERKVEFLVAAHTLAELYAVLTTLPGSPMISPALARRLIRENVEKHAKVIPLTASEYSLTLTDAAESELAGGSIYDALMVRATMKAEADLLLTFNLKHFARAWPDGGQRIVEP
jgi:predicted nucleic acid-binding protein